MSKMNHSAKAQELINEIQLRNNWIDITMKPESVYAENIRLGYTLSQAFVFTQRFYDHLYSEIGR